MKRSPSASTFQLHSDLHKASPGTPNSPFPGCGIGFQSLQQAASASRREMEVWIGLPGGVLGSGLARWGSSAAGCAPSVKVEETYQLIDCTHELC